MQWNKKDIDGSLVRGLSERFGMDLLAASILVRRGITDPESLRFFFEQDLRFLHMPFHFAEMEDAVERIEQARYQKERVFVFGDRDVDGITSIVVLYHALTSIGLDTVWSLPTEDEPYGLTRKAVDDCLGQGASLIITVDCGISNSEEVAYAAEQGVDVIILDHHNPQDRIPDAVAIINPKMEDSGYPFRDLSGCAVAYKVAWALRFARSEMYNHPICLMNIIPANDTFEIHAVKFMNLVETDRIIENLNPGMVTLEQTRLARFLEGHEIYVYQAGTQIPMLRKLFGKQVLVQALDAAPEIWKEFPALADKTLLRLKDLSRMARYTAREFSELEIFINIFISFVVKRHTSLFAELNRDLSLPALGTIADMMPLLDENRILVKQGLADILSNSPLGLRTLLSRQNLQGRPVTAIDVAWHVSPLLNATGRMGVPDKAVRLLLSENPQECESLIREITALNEERKKVGEKIWDTIMPQAEESLLEFEKKLVLVSGDNIHRGVTGILATRLLQYFRTTAIVVAFMGETVVGSMRSKDGFNVKEFLDSCSEVFYDYGGHDCAAGFSMPREKFDVFKNMVSALVKDMEPSGDDAEKEETLEIDAELPLDYVNPDLIKAVDFFAPYGEANRPLVFLTRGILIKDINIMGKTEKQHVKFLLDTGKFKWPALFWNASGKVNVDFSLGDKVDIVFRVSRNYYQNAETLQLTVLDLKR